jgi:hypothetical protein
VARGRFWATWSMGSLVTRLHKAPVAARWTCSTFHHVETRAQKSRDKRRGVRVLRLVRGAEAGHVKRRGIYVDTCGLSEEQRYSICIHPLFLRMVNLRSGPREARFVRARAASKCASSLPSLIRSYAPRHARTHIQASSHPLTNIWLLHDTLSMGDDERAKGRQPRGLGTRSKGFGFLCFTRSGATMSAAAP